MSTEFGTVAPLLDARLEGTQLFTALANTETNFYYYFQHESDVPDVKFNGVALYAYDANKGDSIELWTEYYVPPLNIWKRYKKFGKNWNIAPNTLMKDILFPTVPKNGVRVVFKYKNSGNNDVDFWINLYNFVDQQLVKPSLLEEGNDW